MKRIIASLLLVAYVLGSQFFVKSGYIFSMVGELVNNESIQALTYDQFDSKYSCWKKNTTTALVPGGAFFAAVDYLPLVFAQNRSSYLFDYEQIALLYVIYPPPDERLISPWVLQKQSIVLVV